VPATAKNVTFDKSVPEKEKAYVPFRLAVVKPP
jgi:hypothetical protein